MEKNSVNLSDQQLIDQILEVNNDINNNSYDIESESYYEYLLQSLLKKYSILSLATKDKFSYSNQDHIKNELVQHKYEKILKDFSLLLGKIRSNNFYFDYQKKNQSNSLFKLLYHLKKLNNDSYDFDKAKKEFDQIESPTLFELTEGFKNVVEANKDLTIYYRYTSNGCITNCLSLEKFSLSKETTLELLLLSYGFAKWF
ncbi:21535_t:CDS:1 [Dentiscutata erythropus]|uniref:21535_t:CDS:1 n=1 Tax=Dentiscutata erythropus TaxID=1348616 RepID=A0A9N9CIR7_9GLOM|nr:21535_t:CDS:1 [Dentiscutata erythropus]